MAEIKFSWWQKGENILANIYWSTKIALIYSFKAGTVLNFSILDKIPKGMEPLGLTGQNNIHASGNRASRMGCRLLRGGVHYLIKHSATWQLPYMPATGWQNSQIHSANSTTGQSWMLSRDMNADPVAISLPGMWGSVNAGDGTRQ